VVVLSAAAVVSAGIVGIESSSIPRSIPLPILLTAAISESPTTIGFADSDLYGMSEADIGRTLDEMNAMGVHDVRILMPWAGVEPREDTHYWNIVDTVVNAAEARDMGVLAVLNSTPSWAVTPGSPKYSGHPASLDDYAEFVSTVAERYEGRISAYEVWNEQNSYKFWSPPDPVAYTELLQAAYPAIKNVDPDATVVAGGLSANITYGNLTVNPVDFLDQMYAAGAQGYFDAVAYHPYHYKMKFSTGGWHPDSPINQVSDMYDIMVANGDGEKLIWSTEYGQPVSVSSESKQAEFLDDMLTTWRELPYAGPSFVYTTRDRLTGSTNIADTMGVLRSDWTWKPAAYVIQDLTEEAATAAARSSALAAAESPLVAASDAASLDSSDESIPTPPESQETQPAESVALGEADLAAASTSAIRNEDAPAPSAPTDAIVPTPATEPTVNSVPPAELETAPPSSNVAIESSGTSVTSSATNVASTTASEAATESAGTQTTDQAASDRESGTTTNTVAPSDEPQKQSRRGVKRSATVQKSDASVKSDPPKAMDSADTPTSPR
jgi:hypothetical protein